MTTSMLILIPTRLELERIQRRLPAEAAVRVCGFGPVAAAAATARWLGELSPRRVLLVGLAGAFDEGSLEIGEAYWFDQAVCDGVGAGQGEAHRGAAELGWPQYDDGRLRIGDQLPLQPCRAPGVLPRRGGVLLTVPSASANPAEAELRSRRQGAAAEDMEAYGVAVACALYGVPCTVIRGVSNRAGRRDKQHWRIDDALQAAARLARQELDFATNCSSETP